MIKGIIYTLLGLIAFSGLGFFYKMTVYKKCNIKNVLFLASGSSLLLAFILLLIFKYYLDFTAFIIGIIGGIMLYIALYFYINSLNLGKKVITWVIFKMSLIIAVAFSIFLWKERPELIQIIGFFFMLSAIILLGIDMKIKDHK